jgi:glycine/D-amino acid oxidase-like deaminating enzyme
MIMAKKILIIGSGIIGASLAYHLVARGGEVTVLEAKASVGGVATPNTWGWINASWGNPAPYVRLRMAAMAMWRPLANVHPKLTVNWCGGLLWDLGEEELAAYAGHHEKMGYEVRLVDHEEAVWLEPHLIHTPQFVAYSNAEGMIEPDDAVDGFVRAAEALGARFFLNQSVSQFVMSNGRIVGVKCGDVFWPADDVVLAAGAATNSLLENIDVELNVNSPAGLLVHTRPTAKILNGLVMSPEFHVRQTNKGRLVLGSDFGGTQPGDDPAKTAAEVLAKLPSLVAGTADLEMEYYTLGYRPTPADGFPAIGRLKDIDGLYVVVTHSGITLAPAIGAFVATEILDGVRHELLALYHPDRLIV